MTQESLLRVDMRSLTLSKEPLPAHWRAIGGRALVARVMLEEGDPSCDPLGRNNLLIFATGFFAGHVGVSSSGRISVGTKSPMTGGIKEANGGGTLGHKLGRLGYRLILVTGVAPAGQRYLLHVDAQGARLLPADDLWGTTCFPTAELLRSRFGARVGVASIGPAGERGYLIGGIAVTDSEGGANRYCARGGVAAVMARRGLKAVVVDDAGGGEPNVADKDAFRAATKRFNQALLTHPITGQVYPQMGTPGLVSWVNQIGGLPTRNFSAGSFEHADNISGERLVDIIAERGGQGRTTHACMPGCVIRSSNIYPDVAGKAYCSPIEYETMGLCGSNLGLGSLDELAEVNRWCNDFGVDTIELGAALGIAMEAGYADFGDMAGVRRLLNEIERGTDLGKLLGQGATAAGKSLGVARVPALMGQAISAYDPRAVKGNGVTYMTSPQGADHTAGNTVRLKIDHADPAGKVELSRTVQINAAAIDATGICLFAGAPVNADQSLIRDLVAAKFGDAVPEDYWTRLGKATLRDELAFNDAAGVPPVQDRLPDFFRREPLPPTGAVFDVPVEEIETTLRF